MDVRIISYNEAIEFLLPRHYSGRKPQVTLAYGLYDNNILSAVCTFGKPASNSLCRGVCGDEYSKNVYELNRLCRLDNLEIQLSQFVSYCLRDLKQRDWIVVSYSDTGMNHNGYIYQACNFIYTGMTHQRTDKWTEGNKHSRHYSNETQGKYRKIRTAKHRYIYFCSSDKKLIREWKRSLKYQIMEYPKGENSNYILGEYQKPLLVDTDSGNIISVDIKGELI